jgi:hypothetical protein
MATRNAIRQADLTRALRAARAAGLEVWGYEVDPGTGKITVKTGLIGPKEPVDEFERWKAAHADQA